MDNEDVENIRDTRLKALCKICSSPNIVDKIGSGENLVLHLKPVIGWLVSIMEDYDEDFERSVVNTHALPIIIDNICNDVIEPFICRPTASLGYAPSYFLGYEFVEDIGYAETEKIIGILQHNRGSSHIVRLFPEYREVYYVHGTIEYSDAKLDFVLGVFYGSRDEVLNKAKKIFIEKFESFCKTKEKLCRAMEKSTR